MKNFSSLVLGLAAAAAIIVFLALTLEVYIASEEIKIKVNKVEQIESDSGERYYRVYTNKGVFENRNSAFHRKNNTKTIAKMLKLNNDYKIKVVGYDFGVKLPFFSRYRNIVDVIDGPNIIQGKIK